MDLQEFKLRFNKALLANETMSFFCLCEIKYSGRAEAELELGERLIIVKSDNTILVHQPDGSTPINYMKSDSSISLSEGDNFFVIESYNSKNKDYLDILIYKIFDFNSRKLEDGKKLVLAGSEKDMSDMIKDNPYVISADFSPVSREEHTKYGFIDVFGHDKKGNLVIIECKRYSAGLGAVQQLRRYVEKITELKGVDKSTVKGIIAAPEIAKNAEGMLKDFGYEFRKVDPPKRLERYNSKQRSVFDY
jgi:endonuclease